MQAHFILFENMIQTNGSVGTHETNGIRKATGGAKAVVLTTGQVALSAGTAESHKWNQETDIVGMCDSHHGQHGNKLRVMQSVTKVSSRTTIAVNNRNQNMQSEKVETLADALNKPWRIRWVYALFIPCSSPLLITGVWFRNVDPLTAGAKTSQNSIVTHSNSSEWPAAGW